MLYLSSDAKPMHTLPGRTRWLPHIHAEPSPRPAGLAAPERVTGKPYYPGRGIQGSSTAVYSGGKPMSAITTRLIVHNSWSLYDFVCSHGPWKERGPSRSFDKQLVSGILVPSTLQSRPWIFLLRLCIDGGVGDPRCSQPLKRLHITICEREKCISLS